MKLVFLLMFLVFAAFSSEKNSSWCKCCDKKREKIDVAEFLDAVKRGHTEIVKSIAQKVDLNQVDIYGQSPVYVAAYKGRTEIVEFLAAQNVDLNQADKSGWTPVIVAAWQGRTEIVKLLAKENADLNRTDKYGQSPVYFAAREGRIEIVEFLIESNVILDKNLLSIAKTEEIKNLISKSLQKN